MRRALPVILVLVVTGLGLLAWELHDVAEPPKIPPGAVDDLGDEYGAREPAESAEAGGASVAESWLSSVVTDNPSLAGDGQDLITVRGKVIDSATGSGVEGLRVHFSRRTSVESGAGGVFEVKLRAGNYAVTAVGADYIGEYYRLPLLEVTPDEVILEVSRAAVIAGKVTQDGRPVSGARVSFKSKVGKRVIRGLKLANELGVAASASDGSFELRAIPGDVIVIARSDRGRGEVAIGEVAPGQRKRVEIQLSGKLEVSGTVTDESGRPIENALVSVHPFGRGVSSADFRRARTDAMGQYRIPDAFPGRVAIEAMVEGEGHTGPTRLTLTRDKTQDLRIGPGQTISGRLTQGGEPLSNYKVRAQRPTMRLRLETYTDDGGYFELHGLGRGAPYRIIVYEPGRGRRTVGEFEAPASGVEVELPE